MESTTDNIFVKEARKQFLQYGTHWIQMIADKFPECSETADMKIFFEGVIQNSEPKLTEQIDLWYKNFSTPLNPKKTKYAKAIERITGSVPCLYHALVYRDLPAMEANHQSEVCHQIRLFDKAKDPRLKEADMTNFWKLLDKMTTSCFEAKQVALPTVPTRAEIQSNINIKREKSSQGDEGPSMNRAFQTHINGMCKQLEIASPLEQADDGLVKKWMARWSEFARDQTNGTQNAALCAQHDAQVLVSLSNAFPELKFAHDRVDEHVWKNIVQINGFSAVSDNIPKNMMGRIEDMASRLANDIVEGRTDIASVNLSDIGQQVLSGCSEDEMSKFAGNIENLLPALGSLQ